MAFTSVVAMNYFDFFIQSLDFIKERVTFSVKYHFALVKKEPFCFVSEFCIRIQVLEPP